MFIKYLVVVLLLKSVLSDGPDSCVRYYFEDYDVLFPKDIPEMCDRYPKLWNQGNYDNSTVEAPNEMSNWFITPSRMPSRLDDFVCTPSFLFTMMPGYLVEAKLYLETNPGDSLIVDAMQKTENGSYRLVGWGSLSGAVTGWLKVRVTFNVAEFTENPPYQGYVRFLGRASENSVMILDSFRYVPSWMNPKTECILYEDLTTTSTTTTTTTTTTPPTITTTQTTETTTDDPPSTTMTDIPTTTPTVTSTTTTTTQRTIPDTTPTTRPTTPPKNLTNYFVKELVDFRKSFKFTKKKDNKSCES